VKNLSKESLDSLWITSNLTKSKSNMKGGLILLVYLWIIYKLIEWKSREKRKNLNFKTLVQSQAQRTFHVRPKMKVKIYQI